MGRLVRWLRPYLVAGTVLLAAAWLVVCQWVAPQVAESKRAKVEKVRSSLLYRARFALEDLFKPGTPCRDAANAIVEEFDAMDRGAYLMRPYHLIGLVRAYTTLKGD